MSYKKGEIAACTVLDLTQNKRFLGGKLLIVIDIYEKYM